ncbi:dihydrofolate reductase family protein [Nonomuraea sp. NPDC050536]|uniref:dihydrofolate reductase family protein n=1 Tax=Nonomuraea sp. NPDC050536 TaxID=3364366 RepID=UPI0037C7CB49
MTTITVSEWMSLDGVIQGPSSPDEDPRDGFTDGGWHPQYLDDLVREHTVSGLNRASGFLFGRWTYELFAAYWPTSGPEVRDLSEPLSSKPKYVASRTLTGPLEWQNSMLLKGDLVEAVTALKRDGDGELFVIGSTELVRPLLAHGLVDELRLVIDPIVLGRGKRLFADAVPASLRLVDSQVTGTGAILATYAPANVTRIE